MAIADKKAFIDHTIKIKIDLTTGGNKTFLIPLNFSVKVYFKVISLLDLFAESNNDFARQIMLDEIVTEILKLSDSNINLHWVKNNIDIQTKLDLIDEIITAIKALTNDDCFAIPDIVITDTNNSRERQKIKDDIARYNNILEGKADKYLMEDVAILMAKTANSYTEIMNLPILVYMDMVRTIIVNELRTDDNYNLEYLKQLYKKTDNKLNSGTPTIKPTAERKGGNLQAIKAFAGM
ncbi:MAG: hypothetical protein ACI4VW_06450 [Acutalibacteraceae bacterium]